MFVLRKSKYLTLLLLVAGFTACDVSNTLDTEANSELDENFAQSRTGVNSLLNSAYGHVHLPFFDGGVGHYFLPPLSSGEMWSRFGSIETWFQDMMLLQYDSEHRYINGIHDQYFLAIRNANFVLRSLESQDFEDDFERLKRAEAQFIRGLAYSELYKLFGPLPIHRNPDDINVPRASEEEMLSFIEEQLQSAIQELPVEQEFGRASQGAAMGILAKHYLNTKQWQQAANLSEDIMELGVYRLLEDYESVFAVDNEGNDEILWALTYDPEQKGQFVNALTFPTNYKFPFENNAVFAAETYLFDDFVNSFRNGDERTELLVTEWETASGDSVQGLGNDMTLPRKIEFSPNSSGQSAGNDIPVVRYSDILLTRAEALNELNGPNTESIELINRVRRRAGIQGLQMSDVSSKEALRDTIMKERSWEFFAESKSREDQIRAGTFLEKARERGIENAEPSDRLYPIPQQVIDANPNIEQNEGY